MRSEAVRAAGASAECHTVLAAETVKLAGLFRTVVLGAVLPEGTKPHDEGW
jgi:hypothetical protein